MSAESLSRSHSYSSTTVSPWKVRVTGTFLATGGARTWGCVGWDTSWSLTRTAIAYLGWVQTIDLNADLGEGVTDDLGLLGLVTSANVACGYHAGDELIMRTVCEEAARRGVVV